MDSWGEADPSGVPVAHGNLLSAFGAIPDPRADNARHDLCELLVVGFVSVLCGATNCAKMARLCAARVTRDRARTRMMVSAYAARFRLTLATVAADNGGELEPALEGLGLIALKGNVVMADALHWNRRTVTAITQGGGDYCLALKTNQDSLLSDARACVG